MYWINNYKKDHTIAMQLMTHTESAETLEEAGSMSDTLRKMLTSTSRRVTRRVMRPGTTSGGMRKLIQLAPTNRLVGR